MNWDSVRLDLASGVPCYRWPDRHTVYLPRPFESTRAEHEHLFTDGRSLGEIVAALQRSGDHTMAIKQRVYAEFLRRHGIEWSSLPALNATLENRRAHGDMADGVIEPLARVAGLRKQLFELDMRFAELGERGIFNALDRAGVLDHRVAGVDDIDAAMNTPPRDTRAAVRGQVVQRLTEDGTRYRAEWTQVVDLDHRRVLDLGDPFDAVERWHEVAVAM